MRRVVITGAGPVSAIGVGMEAFAAGLRAGRTGIAEPADADESSTGGRLAARLRDFSVDPFVETPKAYLDRSSAFALAALSLAVRDSGLGQETLASAGLALGSAFGSLETMAVFYEGLLAKGPRLVKPVLFPHTYANTAISLLAIEYGIRGYHINFSAGSTAGALALVSAFDAIRQGKADVMFAGGYEALNGYVIAGCDLEGRLTSAATLAEWAGPFSADRDGLVAGEGAGVLTLETLEHARARNAHVYGELAGAGVYSDSTVDRDMNGGAGVAEAMRRALADAGLASGAIDCVSASANGSVALDGNEAAAIRSVLGGASARTPVTAIKSLTGDTLGASGALQSIAAMASLEEDLIPATAGFEAPEKGMSLKIVCGEPSTGHGLRHIMVNVIDSGGGVVSLVFAKGDGAA